MYIPHYNMEVSIQIFIKRFHCLEKCHKIINNQYKTLSKYMSNSVIKSKILQYI